MEESNNVEERIMRELRVAEAIVDKMLTELQAIVELTGKNGRVDKLVDKVLSTFEQTVYAETLQRRRENFFKLSAKMGRPRRSKSV